MDFASSWIWIAILVSIVVALGGGYAYSRRRIRKAIREGARNILFTHKTLYSGRHEIRQADISKYSRLDLKFYEDMRSWLGARGFQYLGDIENVTLNRFLPAAATFVRVMANETECIVASFYHHLAPTLNINGGKVIQGFLDHRVLELETILSDGTFFSTARAGEARRLQDIPGIYRQFMPPETAPSVLLKYHQDFVDEYTKKNPGLQRVLIDSLDEAIEAMHIAQDIKVRHYKSVDWITEEEFRRLAEGRPPWFVRMMLEEIRRLQHREKPSDR